MYRKRSCTGSSYSPCLNPHLGHELCLVPAYLSRLPMALLPLFLQQERMRNQHPKSTKMTSEVNRELFGSEWLFFLLGYQKPRFYLPGKE